MVAGTAPMPPQSDTLPILPTNLNYTCTNNTNLALLIPLATITIAGKCSATPYKPIPQSQPLTQKLTIQTINLLIKRSATPFGKIQRLPSNN
eukprot:1153418-Pelagomonas_calceolata.AAC.1